MFNQIFSALTNCVKMEVEWKTEGKIEPHNDAKVMRNAKNQQCKEVDMIEIDQSSKRVFINFRIFNPGRQLIRTFNPLSNCSFKYSYLNCPRSMSNFFCQSQYFASAQLNSSPNAAVFNALVIWISTFSGQQEFDLHPGICIMWTNNSHVWQVGFNTLICDTFEYLFR